MIDNGFSLYDLCYFKQLALITTIEEFVEQVHKFRKYSKYDWDEDSYVEPYKNYSKQYLAKCWLEFHFDRDVVRKSSEDEIQQWRKETVDKGCFELYNNYIENY